MNDKVNPETQDSSKTDQDDKIDLVITDIQPDIGINNTQKKEHKLGVFEKFLALWVAICMGIGILLSQFVPIIGNTLNSWQIQNINIPIGICLFFMMYPALLNLQLVK